MTDPSATPMGKDEVLHLLKSLLYRQGHIVASDVALAIPAVTALYAERDSLLTVREVLKRECAALKAERSELIDDVESMQRTNNDLAAENERLRAALAHSPSACAYCQLPREEMAKCRAGLPGCARADDMSGCPEFGAMMESATFRNALEHIAGSCGGRAAEVARAALNGEGHE